MHRNLGSLSAMIETVTPCNRTISQIYNRHNSCSVKVIRTARKCADLVSRSTITHTASCLRYVCGKGVTKFIVTCSHFHTATSKGWSCGAHFPARPVLADPNRVRDATKITQSFKIISLRKRIQKLGKPINIYI